MGVHGAVHMKPETKSKTTSVSRPVQMRIIGSVATVCALIGAFAGTAIAIGRMNTEIMNIRRSVNATRSILDSFSELKNEQLRAAPYQQELSTRFPSDADLLAIAANLEERAQYFHLTQSFSFGIEAPPQDQQPRSVGFSQTINGTLINMVQYFRALESFSVPIQVSHIEGNEAGESLQVNLAGQIFLSSNP
jgi:hypothetical protein